jgi:hypothetical protein
VVYRVFISVSYDKGQCDIYVRMVSMTLLMLRHEVFICIHI